MRWVWSPTANDEPTTRANRMESYYPGDRYVDVLAVDGYNWGATKPEWGGWQTFSQIFKRPYERLKAIGPQPIWIAEVGCAPEGGSKAAWIRDMFARARRMKRLEAIVWFNELKERDWRAAPNAAVAAAFRAGRRRPRLRLMTNRRVRVGGARPCVGARETPSASADGSCI